MVLKNYCPRYGAFRRGKVAIAEHLEVCPEPAQGYNDGFAPGSYTPGSATEESGGRGSHAVPFLIRSTGVWGED